MPIAVFILTKGYRILFDKINRIKEQNSGAFTIVSSSLRTQYRRQAPEMMLPLSVRA